MVKIRLKQTGKKNAKQYRIIVTDSENKRDGRVLDTLGNYDPKPKNSLMTLNMELTEGWIKKGAVMTERVAKIYNLVKNNKVEK
jgi:small subunit ribosomal protein S16